MDSPSGGVRLAPQALASDNRPLCVLTQSPLLCLFCACVGSHSCGYRCHVPVLGFTTSVRVSFLCHDRSNPGEGSGLSEPGDDSGHSFLASASVVPELLELLTEPPLPLPSRWDLLHQPHVRKFHRNLSMLRLHVWRGSSDL